MYRLVSCLLGIIVLAYAEQSEKPRHAPVYRQVKPISNSTSLQNLVVDKYNNVSAEQRLYWGHQPNCPNQPHPPHYPIRCGGLFSGPRTSLASPGFPRPYPSFAQCVYKVLPLKPGAGDACFRVTFAHFAIRWSHNCEEDWIQINEGPRLCGTVTGDRYYRTSAHGLVIEFQSGRLAGPPGSGFNLIVTEEPCYIFQPPVFPPPHHPPVHPPNYPPPHYPPPNYHPPPQHYPPPNYPPHKPNHECPHPPIHHPHKQYLQKPLHKSPDELWWKWLWVLKCEWGGAEYLPPGKCPPPYVPQPGPSHPPRRTPPNVEPSPPTHPAPTQRPPTVIPQGPNCNRIISTSQFRVTSEEWLPRQFPIAHTSWSCQLNIVKAASSSCEVQLALVGVSLRCGSEYLLVGGERVCGEQPLRQMNIDFQGSDATIVYYNFDGSQPGQFEIRGFQNYDCEPFTLDVSLAKKLQLPPSTTPMSPVAPRDTKS